MFTPKIEKEIETRCYGSWGRTGLVSCLVPFVLCHLPLHMRGSASINFDHDLGFLLVICQNQNFQNERIFRMGGIHSVNSKILQILIQTINVVDSDS
ncbi:MAG: hypothetical protein BWK78_10235 [Thiotrichaceae bacterium IS1]|nr:MAG: hypothetical protein BWK78_10235 [Thiotrichaceae bacterium IS1]